VTRAPPRRREDRHDATLALERPSVRWTPGFTALLVYCALLPTAAALLWQMRAQRYLSTARAALIFCCEPVFAALTSRLLLGERLASSQWAGGGLILLGMALADLPLGRQPAGDSRP